MDNDNASDNTVVDVVAHAASAGTTPSNLTLTTARLFAGDAQAIPCRVGFVYAYRSGISVPDTVSDMSTLEDMKASIGVYKAPIVRAVVGDDAGSVAFHAVTAGSQEPADYMPGSSVNKLGSSEVVYVYGAVLLGADGSVVDWLKFTEPKLRPVGYEFALTWTLQFNKGV